MKRGVLVIGTTGSEAPFLSEAELPRHARLNEASSSEQDADSELAEALTTSAREHTSAAAAGPQGDALSPILRAMIAGLNVYRRWCTRRIMVIIDN